MTSYNEIVSIKLCLDVRNDELIILWNIGDRKMGGFKVIEWANTLPTPPSSKQAKKTGLKIGLNANSYFIKLTYIMS